MQKDIFLHCGISTFSTGSEYFLHLNQYMPPLKKYYYLIVIIFIYYSFFSVSDLFFSVSYVEYTK